jgi:plastocyanin
MLSALGAVWLGMGNASGASTGGVIVGHVRYRGTRVLPPIRVPAESAGPCGKTQPSQALIVGKDKGLANAVVSVSGVPSGSPPAPVESSITQKACVFEPHVMAVPVGSRLTFVNTDVCLHNVHLLAGGVTVGNVAMPLKDQRTKLPINVLAKKGNVHFKCDVHSWMDGYVHVFDHPWFAVSDKSGVFRIPDVPPGTHELQIEHELLRGATQKVTVPAGGEVSIDIELK